MGPLHLLSVRCLAFFPTLRTTKSRIPVTSTSCNSAILQQRIGSVRNTLLSLRIEELTLIRAASDDSVQAHFTAAENQALESWTDSELRKFLLTKGIISPHSKHEELVVLAEKHGARAHGAAYAASKSVSSAAAAATDVVKNAGNAVADNAHAAYYSTVNAPSLAYDTAAEKLQGELIDLCIAEHGG